MALEVKKLERENSQNLVRRFSKSVKMSGILKRARANRFYIRTKSEQMDKKSAIRREQLKKEYQTLKKLGKTEK